MDLFDLYAKLSLDTSGYEEGISEAGEKTSGFADKLKTGLATAAKVGGAAIAAGATAFAALAKSALSAGGELEQNMGGSEAVFKGYAQGMQNTADDAYKNMGLSASEFLATANKMGALFQGSGFDISESANLSSEAMQRAADVASIMGIDTSAVMEAISGAAKGNFTMLDNLGVAMNDTTLSAYALEKGIDKTTQEMSNQEKVGLAMEMFMEKTAYAAGNYAKENETLAGSLGTAKAAISNFLSGAGDADAVVESVMGAANVILENLKNIVPRLIEGLSQVVAQLIPQIPPLLQEMLPMLIEGATMLITALVEALPEVVGLLAEAIPMIIEAIITVLPLLVEAGIEIIISLIEGITEALPTLIPAAVDCILKIVDALTDPEMLMELIEAALVLLKALAEGLIDAIPQLVKAAITLIDNLVEFILNPDNIVKLVKMALEIVVAIAGGLVEALPEIIAAAGELVSGLWDTVKNFNWLQLGKDIINGIWTGLKSVWGSLSGWFSRQWNNLTSGVKKLLGISSPSKVFADIGKNMAMGVGKGWEGAFSGVNSDIVDGLSYESKIYSSPRTTVQRTAYAPTQKGDTTIILKLDEMELGRAVYKLNNSESKRIGMKLAGVIA